VPTSTEDTTWDDKNAYVLPWDPTGDIIVDIDDDVDGIVSPPAAGQDVEDPELDVPPGYWSLSRPPVPKRNEPSPSEGDYGGIDIWTMDYSSAISKRQQSWGIACMTVTMGSLVWLAL
jgi:hypothetical protein